LCVFEILLTPLLLATSPTTITLPDATYSHVEQRTIVKGGSISTAQIHLRTTTPNTTQKMTMTER
jgi:hypothetical protein